MAGGRRGNKGGRRKAGPKPGRGAEGSENAAGVRRLQKEAAALARDPAEGLFAVPSELNIFTWHYVILGPRDTPYSGGVYHGLLEFPPEYPFKPPRIRMLTPSGRFAPGKPLCFSMSDFHPDTWNPMWSVRTIVQGIASFMVEDASTAGSIAGSTSQRRALARSSMEFNTKDRNFVKYFPDLIRRYEAAVAAADDEGVANVAEAAADALGAPGSDLPRHAARSDSALASLVWFAVFGSLCFLVYALAQDDPKAVLSRWPASLVTRHLPLDAILDMIGIGDGGAGGSGS